MRKRKKGVVKIEEQVLLSGFHSNEGMRQTIMQQFQDKVLCCFRLLIGNTVIVNIAHGRKKDKQVNCVKIQVLRTTNDWLITTNRICGIGHLLGA